MRYEITEISKDEKLIEVWDSDDSQIVYYPLTIHDSEYDGEEISGLENFTWRENIESLAESLNDYDVEEETAERIIDELDSWIADASLSEEDGIRRDITWWETRIAGYAETMESHQSLILESYKEIEEIRKRIRRERQRVKEIQMEIGKFNLKIRDLEEQLKGREV